MPRPAPHLRGLLATLLAAVLVGSTLGLTTGPGAATAAPAAPPVAAPAAASAAASAASARRSGNPVTPGNFTGYGFDQCLAPSQKAMNRWLNYSPFLAVGIYISGKSRACRNQPNLTPAWISTQLRRGWRLLPITLGPQASCQPRFPRYQDDVRINPAPGANGRYTKARTMGRNEATSAVEAAAALGIVPGSTLWYDLEGYDNANTHCRESAMAFLTGWTNQLHTLGYVSGVYSSAGSGIKQLDTIRATKDARYTVPDMIWVARWDGKANTSSSYLREDGWRPGGRVKQYRGGHDETWGGVRINIDSNYLDLGRGSVAPAESHCGVRVDFPSYGSLKPPKTGAKPDPTRVRALQCLMKEKGGYTGRINGVFNRRLLASVRSWSARQGLPVVDGFSRRHWTALLVAGPRQVLKVGSAGPEVRRVQRALNAAGKAKLPVNGVFGPSTTTALKAWQAKVRLPRTGVVSAGSWKLLEQGYRKR
ncbi:glycoside hydrolase domain-containing protein [Nocardioides pantholopis]|uniref:glycoside hydrolase domain-containing protein n=1 Tax=Nocardioides pantholopis TaxID=2483798 RepID=UPI000F098D93|nr:glycoside hydrolase domain-containing protein [Nocardioides pantholopis]